MKIYHFYIVKAPLLFAGYAFGTMDPAFLYAGMLSLFAIPFFIWADE
jgi:hypothetical protein